MSSNAIEAQGMKIQRGTGSGPVTYTDIPEIKSFSGPGGSASVRDASDLNSTAKEKKMGLSDEGQLQFTINYLPSNAVHAGLRADRAARTKTPFKMIFTDTGGMAWDFEAYVTGFSVSGGVDTDVEAQVTLEITGEITETP